jgi:hypothetical protein
MLDEWAISRKEKACNMDCLCMPKLTIFNREFLRVQNRQKAQLRPNTEIRHNYVQSLIEQGVFTDLRQNKVCKVVSGILLIVKFVETDGLQMHDVPDVECLDPIVFSTCFEAER